MPCRVSSDVHEWNNEGPAVPACSPVKPHNVDEQSTNLCRGEKTLWSFTAACCCDMVVDAESSGSLRSQPSGVDGGKSVTPAIYNRIANPLSRGHRQVGSSAGAAPP